MWKSHWEAKSMDDALNEVEFNLATADIKGRRFDMAATKFESLAKTTNSSRAWCGLALSKLGMATRDNATVEEVFFCFETAKKLDLANASEIDEVVAENAFGAIAELYAVKKMSRLAKNEAQKQLLTGALTAIAGGVIGARRNASIYSSIVWGGHDNIWRESNLRCK